MPKSKERERGMNQRQHLGMRQPERCVQHRQQDRGRGRQ